MKPYHLLFGILAIAGACSKPPENSAPKREIQRATVSGLIGNWCFKPSTLRSTWELIQISKGPSYSLTSHFGDGSTRHSDLNERADGLWERDSTSGDHYVVPSKKGGDLVVADNDGEIGRASALSDAADPADCFQS